MVEAASSSRPLIILNPAANRGRMEYHRSLVRRRIEADQADIAYIETAKVGEAREFARQAAREGRPIVIVGGDGSLNEVVNGILTSGRVVPLGIVPAGSGNDYACNTLGLPRDPEAALERALNGSPLAVDAGIVNGRYFINAFSVGLDADIARAAEILKRYPLMSGARLYYTATLKQLLFAYHRCPRLTFSLDAETAHVEQQYVLLAISNGPTYGAGFRINPRADHTDGYFDVCAILYTPLLRALRLLPRVKQGRHEGLREALFYRARTVQIEARGPVHLQIDGEIASAAHIEASILPAALQVRV
uniref:Diacylglycerol kinase n=1 Tax=Thermosporothrix sp. COM3 TaxID=2490863 RepID=A0A455T1L9_9CHLR|nr:diacylglycerol kinase [Thermosporothrix sp. COM3]